MIGEPQPAAGGPRLARQLAALVDLVRAISRSHDAREIYEPVLSALHVIVGVDRAAILLLDQEGVARFVAWRGLSESYRRAVEGHFPWRLDDPAPDAVVVPDVESDPAVDTLRPALRKEGIRAIAFLPLVYRDRLVGKFMVYGDRPNALRAEDLDLARALAYLVAFAIERTRLYAELEESDARKDTFLATLSHELRNPLAPIAAALALVRESPGDAPIRERAQDILERNVAQIVKLVDDLLDVSRITRGVIALDKKPVDLSRAVHDAVAPVEGLIATQRHELTLALAPLWVEADLVRLEQVITNLVHNAAKYTPPGGAIRVSTRATDGDVEIRVEDNGIGLDPAIIPRLFDLFVQADKSLARTRGGLGIGLTIVRKLVDLHGGTVSAASAGEGKGAVFTVRLPGRIGPALPPRLPAPERATPTARRRILVVDDNEDAASTLALLLESWGHEVSTVADGPATLAAVAAQRPDVVLLDLGLPGMSGYEVAERLRAAGEKSLRIIAVSGYGQPEDVARSRAAGCDGHLPKPVDLAALQHMLANAS